MVAKRSVTRRIEMSLMGFALLLVGLIMVVIAGTIQLRIVHSQGRMEDTVIRMVKPNCLKDERVDKMMNTLGIISAEAQYKPIDEAAYRKLVETMEQINRREAEWLREGIIIYQTQGRE